MQNRYADQTDNSNTDPLRRHVEHVGTDRQANDQDDVPYDIDPKRHCCPPLILVLDPGGKLELSQ